MWHSFCLKWHLSGLVTEVVFYSKQNDTILECSLFDELVILKYYQDHLLENFPLSCHLSHYSSLHLWLLMLCTHLLCSILYSYVPDYSFFFSGFEKIYLVYTVDSCCAVTKLCLIHWDPIDCIMPGSFVILSLRVCSNSCPLSQWCYLVISSHVISFSFCLQSFPGSGSFPVSWLFAVGGQYFGTSVST